MINYQLIVYTIILLPIYIEFKFFSLVGMWVFILVVELQ